MICSTVLCNQLRFQAHYVRKQTMTSGWSDTRPAGMDTNLWLVLKGSAYLHVGDKQYRVKAGDLCLLPETEHMTFGCDGEQDLVLWYTHMKTDMPTGTLFDWIECSDWVVSLSNKEQKTCEQYFEQMSTASSREASVKQQFAVHCALYNLLCFFLARVEVKENKQESWIGNTLQYIREHLDEDLSIETLARRVALHPNYFIRCFRTRMGISPARYIAGMRFQCAKALIDAGNKNMQEIADAIGMSELPVFYSFFKRHMHLTPHQYLAKKESEETI